MNVLQKKWDVEKIREEKVRESGGREGYIKAAPKNLILFVAGPNSAGRWWS